MLPDPIELMETRIDDLSHEWSAAQVGVPEGQYRCPYCRKIFGYESIQHGSSPDSPASCYECLPADAKAAYDKFWASKRIEDAIALEVFIGKENMRCPHP